LKKASKNPRFLILKVKRYERFKSIAHTIQLVSVSLLTKYESLILLKSISFISFFFKKIEYFYNWREDSFCIKFLIYIYTADKSCCGSLNSRTVQTVSLFLKKINNNINYVYKIYFFGVAGALLMKRKFKKSIKSTIFNTDLSKSNYPLIQSFSIFNIIDFDFDRIFFFFNFYISRLFQKCGKYAISSYEILWLNYWKYKYLFDKIGFSFKFKKINYVFILYFIFLFTNAFYENELSSYGARAKTMENAVSNTEKTISYLKLRYNKLRQSGITSQIIEVLNASIA
jgi:ATP synthase F1 gamma subunit